MLGPEEVTSELINDYAIVTKEIQEKAGVIPQSIFYLFERLTCSKDVIEFNIKCSYLEIYNESVNDLLANPPAHNLKIREFPHLGMVVIGSTEKGVANPEDIFACLALGTLNRITGATELNQRSSRSHTLFIITLEQKFLSGSSKISRLNLIDLAGSEKVSKTGAVGQALREAQNINLSLTTLGRCIKALSSPKSEHIPFRESKLTMILKESLGGNAKTVLICAASLKQMHIEEGRSTLKFAERAKRVQTKAKTNIKRSQDELLLIIEQLKSEITTLKRQLRESPTSPSHRRSAANPDEDLTIKFAELKAQYDSLTESAEYEIAQLKAKNEQLMELAVRYPVQIQEQLGQIEELNVRIAEVERERDNIRKNLEGEVEDLMMKWESLGRELEICKKEKDGTAALLGKIQEETFDKEQEIEKMTEKIQSCELQMKQDSDKIANFRENSVKQTKIIEELTKEKLDLQNSLNSQREKEVSLQAEIVTIQSALETAVRENDLHSNATLKILDLESTIRHLNSIVASKDEAYNHLSEKTKRNALDYQVQIVSLTEQLEEIKKTAGRGENKSHSAQTREILSRVMKEMSDVQNVYQETVVNFKLELTRAQAEVEEGRKKLQEREIQLGKELQAETTKAAEYSKSWKLALIEQDSLKFLASKAKSDLAAITAELQRERSLRIAVQSELNELRAQRENISKVCMSQLPDTEVANHRLKTMKRQYRASMHDSEVQLLRYTAENTTLAEALAAKESEMRVQMSRIRELESRLREMSSKAQRVEENLFALRKRRQSSVLGVVVHSDLLLRQHMSYSSQSSTEEDRGPSRIVWRLPHRDLYGLQDIQSLYSSNEDKSEGSVCLLGTEDSAESDQEAEDLLE